MLETLGVAVTPFLNAIGSDNEVQNIDMESYLASQASQLASVATDRPSMALKPRLTASRR